MKEAFGAFLIIISIAKPFAFWERYRRKPVPKRVADLRKDEIRAAGGDGPSSYTRSKNPLIGKKS